MIELFGLAAAAFAVALAVTPAARQLARRLDLLDRPLDAPHKSHLEAIPYGGGIAILCGLLASGVFVPFAEPAGALIAAGLAILALGLLDDWRGIPPLLRFVVQLGITAWIAVSLPACRLPLAASSLPVQVAATALFITAVTNAFNFLDNMDGLAAGLGMIVLSFLGMYALEIGLLPVAHLGLGLAAALGGFLVYNFPPAKIFMGDAGGLFIGFIVGAISVALIQQVHADQAIGFAPHYLAPLIPLTVPLYDFVSVIIIRLRNHTLPWTGDHNHISHRLARSGFSRRGAVLAIYGAALLTSLPTLFMDSDRTSDWVLLLLAPGCAAAIAVFEISCARKCGGALAEGEVQTHD